MPVLRCHLVISAVFWDFGGVVLTSPFAAFAGYETELGLPEGFIRRVNTTNQHDNAWARLERAELDVTGFARAFEAEARAIDTTGAAEAIDGERVVALLAGDVRPEMVAAIDAVRARRLTQACLTNNHPAGDEVDPERERRVAEVMARFDHVVESSKVGVRKPEPRFYEIACELAGVEPAQCVFLDDLGINLKPARAMGMHTIKVGDPRQALGELSQVLGFSVGS
jgi:putative hydrolase of the HAD superfamily